MGGYVLARYKAVSGDGGAPSRHPAAFDAVECMPPPPPPERCSLPDRRLLAITVSEGTMPWPDGV